MLEKDYPYKGRDMTCKYNKSKATDINVDSWKAVTPNSSNAMKQALATQPLAVSIDAAGSHFMNYSHGIYDRQNLLIRLDHATLAVGYGTENGTPFWIMKNSWNTSWGEKGYMRIQIVDGPGIVGIQKEPLTVKTNK